MSETQLPEPQPSKEINPRVAGLEGRLLQAYESVLHPQHLADRNIAAGFLDVIHPVVTEQIEEEDRQIAAAIATGQAQVVAGVNDVLGNILSLPHGYKILRDSGRTEGIPSDTEILEQLVADLTSLNRKLTLAEHKLGQDESLPVIEEGHKKMVDFKYDSLNPEQPDQPASNTSEK